MDKIKVSIVGATGFTGNELIRILKAHPYAEIEMLTSSSKVGKKISEVCPHLKNVTNLKLKKYSDDVFESDVVFFALPNGESSKIIRKIPEKSKIIDLAGDFRISDQVVFEKFYKIKHPHIQKDFTYGFPEKNREKIQASNLISNPGCFATAIEIALYPFIEITEKYFISGLTGSSGSGRKPTEMTHHSIRSGNIKTYKVNEHQHIPEIFEALELSPATEFYFSPHSVPCVRGILVSAFLELKTRTSEENILELLNQKYKDEKQIRIIEDAQTLFVKGTNFCDISVKMLNPHKIFVSTAIDNLVKGAAGNAVQNMNIMFGMSENEGLKNLSPVFP